MNVKVVFSFILGLILGVGAGYIATDLHYRRMAIASPAAPGQAQKPKATGTDAMADVHGRIKILEGLLIKDPGNLNARIELGNMYYDSGQFAKAIPHYQKAVEIKPDQPDVLSDLGTCFREAGDAVQAVQLYEKAYAIDKGHWRSLFNALVVSLHDLKDKEKAQMYLNQLLPLNPPGVDLKSLEAEIRQLP